MTRLTVAMNAVHVLSMPRYNRPVCHTFIMKKPITIAISIIFVMAYQLIPLIHSTLTSLFKLKYRITASVTENNQIEGSRSNW